MHILISVNSLQQGGAERSAIKLANGLSSDGHQVAIFTWNSSKDFFEPPSLASRIYLPLRFSGASKTRKLLPNFLNYRMQLIFDIMRFRYLVISKKFDVVIGFESIVGSVVALSLLNSHTPVIVSERISPDPDVHEPQRLARKLRPWIYEHGAVCSVQSEAIKTWVKKHWEIDSVITKNHLDNEWFEGESFSIREKTVTALGRFDAQKGFDNLISAWALIQSEVQDWNLVIYGRGDITSYYYLMQEINCPRVQFKPASPNVAEILRRTGVFVSSSRYEGFPNVVLEALACEAPAVATESSDVIVNFGRQNALLTVQPENVEQLAHSLERLINSPDIRKELAIKGAELAKEYRWENVREGWYSAIQEAQKNKGVSIFPRIRTGGKLTIPDIKKIAEGIEQNHKRDPEVK